MKINIKNSSISNFIVILFLSACTLDTSVSSDLIDVVSPNSFQDKSFDSITSLKSMGFNDTVVHNPVRVALNDSILFSIDANYGTDTLVRCFSLFDKRYLGAIFLKGNGPGELLSAATLGLSADSSSFWTFDITKQLWKGRCCNELYDHISLPNSDCKNLNLKDTALLAKDNPIWLQNGYVVKSLFKYKERFFIYDSAMNSCRSAVNPYMQFKEVYAPSIMADIFSTQMCTNPDRTIIVLAGKYLDLIEIYDSDGNLKKMLKGPQKGFDFRFDVERSMNNSVCVKSKDSRKAYLAVRATQSKIYALYSGKTKEDKEHYSYSKTLYVFSLTGELLFKYILDKPVMDFVVDEKRKCIYATSIDAEIIYFNL